jgi:hypothetical protein
MTRLRAVILVVAVALAVPLVWVASAFAARGLAVIKPVDGERVAVAGIGSFRLLPAGSALPSPTDCASAVQRSSWEWRPENRQWTVDYPVHVDSWSSVTTAWNNVRGRVTGDMGGFADDDGTPPEAEEVIQFFACKWGLDDNWMHAEALAESTWRQRSAGDWTTNFSWCARGAPTRNSGAECAQSLGFMQIKTRFRPASIYPAIWDSLVAHLDYFGWEFRGCIEGQKWVASGQLSTPNDLRGCLGNWFSGGWYDANGEDYYARVKAFHGVLTRLSDSVRASP